MTSLFEWTAGLLLLGVGYTVYTRYRERALMERLKRAGHDPSAIIGVMDSAIHDEKARREFWRHQSGK